MYKKTGNASAMESSLAQDSIKSYSAC